MASLKDYRDEQLTQLEKLRELGVDPYPANSKRNLSVADALANFEDKEGTEAVLAGRIMSIREHGKIIFIDIADGTDTIQLIVHSESIKADYPEGELAFTDLNLLTRGDFVEAHGELANSKRGEKSVIVDSLRLLAKVLRPLPEKLEDKETRFRRRYLDMSINPDVRARFARRAAFWKATRDYLDDAGFLEINTPVLEHTTGGADAKPFVTHMETLDEQFYLRISHELPLKRLIGGGFERVYDIGPRFRNEQFSDEHLPEHVAMESYAAYQDFDQGISFYEEMLKQVVKATWNTLQFKVQDLEVNLDQEWPRVAYADIMKENFNVDVFNPNMDQLKTLLKENQVELDGEVTMGRAMDSLWKVIRRKSAGPFWLIHEPVSISPLAKADPNDSRISQRIHPIIGGTELGNGYAELNDPQVQLARFTEQQALRDAGDDEAQMLDIDFVEMLEYGMPPAFGWGYSERVFWLLEGVSAREGVPFTHMRRETDDSTKQIYGDLV